MEMLRLVGEKKLSSHLIGSWLERFDSEYSPLIPDPLCWKWRNSRGYLICHKTMDLGSVINDCGDKHYNIGRDTGRYGIV
jgi:hypothetical protein